MKRELYVVALLFFAALHVSLVVAEGQPLKKPSENAGHLLTVALQHLDKDQTQQNVDEAVKCGLKFLNHTYPYDAFLRFIRPLGQLAAKHKVDLPAKLVSAFEAYSPYYAGTLISIFLEARLRDEAMQALNQIMQAEQFATATTDIVIAAIMTQAATVAVFNARRADEAALLFYSSPYKFCAKVYDYAYGGILHLLVPFAMGNIGEDMPAMLAPGMISFASALITLLQRAEPQVFVVKNSSGKTAREAVSDAIAAMKAKRPVSTHVLEVVVELL